MFKALGDPVRLRLVSLIGARDGGEVCVCDLTSAFDLSQPTISHHLKVLREAGLIDSERRGTWVYYRLVPAALERMAGMLSVPVSRPAGRGSQARRARGCTQATEIRARPPPPLTPRPRVMGQAQQAPADAGSSDGRACRSTVRRRQSGGRTRV